MHKGLDLKSYAMSKAPLEPELPLQVSAYLPSYSAVYTDKHLDSCLAFRRLVYQWFSLFTFSIAHWARLTLSLELAQKFPQCWCTLVRQASYLHLFANLNLAVYLMDI
jgi:hypothetical protein